MDIATDAAVGVLPLNVPQRMTFDGHPSPDPFPADTLGVGVPNVTSLIHRVGSEGTLQSAESERPHRCPACGVPYATQEDDEGCPVCLLRRAMQPAATVQDLPDEGRFDHYEIVRRDDGCFDQLGRGAMGVTYRALDTVLGHAVALKVIDARIAGSR